jgi:hypothetical protein
MATRQDASEQIIVRVKALRIFELHVGVTDFLPGELKDWPPNIQDGIYGAMERLIAKTGVRSLRVLVSSCGRSDVDEPYRIAVTVCEDSKEGVEIERLPGISAT